MRYLIMLLLLFCCSVGWTDELRHIIHDSDVMGKNNWEETKCINGTYDHIYIRLCYCDWIKICKLTSRSFKSDVINWDRAEHFQADFCVRCRLIPVRCSGNDWFRLICVGK